MKITESKYDDLVRACIETPMTFMTLLDWMLLVNVYLSFTKENNQNTRVFLIKESVYLLGEITDVCSFHQTLHQIEEDLFEKGYVGSYDKRIYAPSWVNVVVTNNCRTILTELARKKGIVFTDDLNNATYRLTNLIPTTCGGCGIVRQDTIPPSKVCSCCEFKQSDGFFARLCRWGK